MTRFLLAPALLLSAALPALAQDMPLSQILIDGEGWKKVENAPRPKGLGYSNTATASKAWVTASVHSADGMTKYFAVRDKKYLWAEQVSKDGPLAVVPAAPYAPLRTKRGEKFIRVTDLTADGDGRIYAATEIGVQVFDPTGRLCGVLTPAAPGAPEYMAFEGDKLTIWVGNTKYARKLNTEGVK